MEETALLAASHDNLPLSALKELLAKSETVTPAWWALWVLIKVREEEGVGLTVHTYS